MSQKRTYQLKRRAERQDETRRRIVEAVYALHQQAGPAATTIKDIAERAGVERLTVYRHFPDERELLQACQARFLGEHPMPDLAAWGAIPDPRERLRTALTALYARYRATEVMTANVLRDAPGIPVLAELTAGLPNHYAAARDILAAGWDVSEGRRPLLLAAIGHALDFETWRSIARRQGLPDEGAVALMVTFISCVASGDASPPSLPS